MKRPVPIYFVATLGFFVLVLQTGALVRLGERLFPVGPVGPRGDDQLWTSVRGLMFLLVIWHTVRLVQLKAFNRWLSVASFAWATVSLISFNFVRGWGEGTPLRPIVSSVVIGALSLASVFYLTRRPFRDYALQFVAEREREKNSRMMQKSAEKALMKDLKR